MSRLLSAADASTPLISGPAGYGKIIAEDDSRGSRMSLLPTSGLMRLIT
jgi:hypothetical protein